MFAESIQCHTHEVESQKCLQIYEAPVVHLKLGSSRRVLLAWQLASLVLSRPDSRLIICNHKMLGMLSYMHSIDTMYALRSISTPVPVASR